MLKQLEYERTDELIAATMKADDTIQRISACTAKIAKWTDRTPPVPI